MIVTLRIGSTFLVFFLFLHSFFVDAVQRFHYKAPPRMGNHVTFFNKLNSLCDARVGRCRGLSEFWANSRPERACSSAG